jgi:cystathionine beta-lyase/cystathionine gamma-synthase
VDASAASPATFAPIRHGADVVLHDASLLLGTGMPAGVVCGTDRVVEEVRAKMETWGAIPGTDACRSLEQGLATLSVRVAHAQNTARAVATWAQQAAAVRDVVYPGLSSHPDHALLAEWFTGSATTLLLAPHDVASVDAAAARAMHALHGDARAERPSGGVHTRVTPAVETGWLRVQVGLEPPDQIITALAGALAPAGDAPE